MIIGKQAAAPRLSRHCLENMASVDGQERDGYAKSKEVLTHFGGLLYVVLSVLFGSVWYATLSTVMTRIEP
jgi:hypothetical protein